MNFKKKQKDCFQDVLTTKLEFQTGKQQLGIVQSQGEGEGAWKKSLIQACWSPEHISAQGQVAAGAEGPSFTIFHSGVI